MGKKEIYLIRHGETESNKKGIFRGRLDISLSETGREQAKFTKEYFKSINVEAVLSSPLKRSVETAKIIFPEKKIIIEERLNNLDLGKWSGIEKNKIKKENPKMWKLWTEIPEKIVFPEGESIRDVYKRVCSLLESIKKMEYEKLSLVSHRSVLKTLIACAIGLKNDFFWKFHLDNASVSTLIYDQKKGYVLYKMNDTSHLKSFVTEWF